MPHAGLKLGVFLAPVHRPGDDLTRALARDLELPGALDTLGHDEAWIGEHHSAGWETTASPELIIAAAAERRRHIRPGSGVTSRPCHDPSLVAQRLVQPDHMTGGRAMLGCGPAALVSDAPMTGIAARTQRPRMAEALAALRALPGARDRPAEAAGA